MPSYEMPVLLRAMSRPELISTLKRVAGVIFNEGGIIRRLENLGTQDLPYKIHAHGKCHRRTSRFVFEFVAPPRSLKVLQDEYNRDVDIVRSCIFKADEPEPIECTLHEESLPPAYRKEVQKMVEIAERRHKPKFKDNSGLHYYPFQK